jgi:uncharacterized integral membrane protein (TIGR00697 family)
MPLPHLITDPAIAASRPSKYLGIFGMIWVTFLIVAMFTAAKTFYLGPANFSVSILAYPFTYIFADIFTEVYGYRVTRRIVWTGLVCLLLASSVAYLYSIIPPSPSYTDDASFKLIFKASPVLAMANILSFFGGELTNSFVLAKMKIRTRGSMLWMRLIGSTLAGQFVDNSIFFLTVFFVAGIFQSSELVSLILTAVVFCTTWEAIISPLTHRVIGFLKKKEGLDTFDHGTNFNPFALR